MLSQAAQSKSLGPISLGLCRVLHPSSRPLVITAGRACIAGPLSFISPVLIDAVLPSSDTVGLGISERADVGLFPAPSF